MKPASVDLPTIWRGSDWAAVFFYWKDQNGNPFNLTGWTFRAQTKDFDLHGQIQPPATSGLTAVILTHEVTGTFSLGVETWNCWFIDPTGNVSPPLLGGKVEVKEKITTI